MRVKKLVKILALSLNFVNLLIVIAAIFFNLPVWFVTTVAIIDAVIVCINGCLDWAESRNNDDTPKK